jgi:7-cyano-7-deazaguanine synthase
MMNTNASDSALVLFSGGQDSTTCLFWAMRAFSRVEAVCFLYGQRHACETDTARSIAAELNVPFHLVEVPVLGSLAPSSLTDTSISMDASQPPGGYPNTFVPGRNMLFLTLAAIQARTLGIRNLVTGVSQADYSGYPDCRDTFIRSANVSLNLAMDEHFVIHTPLMWRDKAAVWQLADELGRFDYVRERTITCYKGIPAEGCGSCPSCILRRKGLEEYHQIKQS